VTEDGPRVVPMNYLIVSDSIVLLTSALSEAATHSLDRRVAFEVDQLNTLLRSGWSVLAVGVAQEMPLALREALDVASTPEPWPGGVRSLVMQIGVEQLTGRRIHPA
jgi:hypothetical protein